MRVQFTHVETRRHLVKLEMGEIEILISCNYAANVTPKQNTKRTKPPPKNTNKINEPLNNMACKIRGKLRSGKIYLKRADIPLVGCLANDTENLFTGGIENSSEEIREVTGVTKAVVYMWVSVCVSVYVSVYLTAYQCQSTNSVKCCSCSIRSSSSHLPNHQNGQDRIKGKGYA